MKQFLTLSKIRIMRFFFSLVFTLSVLGIRTQNTLSGELKAYMYHVVKKSPILDSNIGRYFEYSGPDIRLPNNNINYDSIDILISNFPDYLFIRSSEIAKCSPGIVAELANKTAIWELNKTMLAYLSDDESEKLRFQNHFNKYEKLLVEYLPATQVKTTSSGKTFNPKLKEALNPSISFNIKKDLLEGKPGMHTFIIKEILEAINNAVIHWVQDRTHYIFRALGANTRDFNNILLAGGDGSYTSGMLNEREKDVRGRFGKGLPRAIGFFPYQIKIQADDKGQDKVLPVYFPSVDLFTAGNGRITNLHPDIWGYNDKKQTTLVIEKNKRQYILFGSAETRFLSPDSNFTDNGTFMSIINELEQKHIADLKEKIYGKKGFDFLIAYNEEQLKITKKEVIDIDQALQKLKSSNTRNSTKGKKKIQALQTKFINKQNHYDRCENKIKKLTIDKAEASEKLDEYEARLSMYKKLIGSNWVPYKVNADGLFTFDDGATFDLKTQDFRFPPSFTQEAFEVRLLPVPTSALSNKVDEVMLHLTVSDMPPDFNLKFKLNKVDWFAPNEYTLNQNIFSAGDSVVVYDILQALSAGTKLNIRASGMGIGILINDTLVKKQTPIELSTYPGENQEERALAAQSLEFKGLRMTKISCDLSEDLLFKVSSFTDPVRATFEPQNHQLNKLVQQEKINKNDALSVYRTAHVLFALKNELIQYAGIYLPREDAARVIESLETDFKKIQITFDKYKVALEDLK